MGLVNSLAQNYGTKIILDIIKEKSLPLYHAIDALDEKSLGVLVADLIEEERNIVLGEVIYVNEIKNKINMEKYLIELLRGNVPVLVTIQKLIKELGLTEIGGINLSDFLTNLSKD